MNTATLLNPSPAPAPPRSEVAPAPAIRREIDTQGLCHLIFDTPGTSANVFNVSTLHELEAHVKWLAESGRMAGVRGVLLRSAKPSIFIAGADLYTLANATPDELLTVLELGQNVFNAFARLPFPKIAAIHGACLGGGYELALTCDMRIASGHPTTKIGLPETQLGLVPAWGGSTRLPRLIGVPRALHVILKGAMLSAREAKRLGLIDHVVVTGCVVEGAARRLLALAEAGKTTPPGRRPGFGLPGPRHWVAPVAEGLTRHRLNRQTRGHYPALEAAAQLVARAPWRSEAASLAAERNAMLTLFRRPETRRLLSLFFAKEKARKLSVPGLAALEETHAPKDQHIAVMGAGVMGTGLAHWLALRGKTVLLLDIDHTALAHASGRLDKLFAESLSRRAVTPTEAQAARDRITLALSSTPLDRVDAVLEAAVEDPALKRQLFADVIARSRPDTLLATNTSAIPLHTLADDPRLVGLHFFNPVAAMPLVEIVRPKAASETAVARAVRLVKDIGKTPLLVKDRPGFLINRILLPYLLEAARLVECGVAVRVIDDALLHFGMPMGPLRLLDEIGLDVASHVAETMAAAFPEVAAPPALVTKWVAEGRLGKKSGLGFYRHIKGKAIPQGHSGGDPREVAERLSLLLVNEAARCLEEGIVATAEELDLGMVLGTGFAPFRGGPLHYADDAGLTWVVERLRHWRGAAGPLYTPAPQLERLAAENGSFFPPATPSRL